MLRTRLYLGLLPLLLLVVGSGGYAIYVTRELAGSLQRDLIGNYRDILACQQMRASVRLMTSAVSLARRGEPLAAQQEFEEQRAAFTRELMEQSARSAGTPRAAFIERLDDAFTEVATRGEALLQAGGAGRLEVVQAHERALYRTLAAIEELNGRDFAAAQQTAARAEQMQATTERVLFTAIIVAFVLSLLVAWRLAAALLKPIKALTASAVAVGEGELERDVPAESRDELGQLGRAFNQMAVKLRAYRDATMAKVLRTQRTMEATLTSTPDPVFVVARDGTQEVRNPAADQLAATADFAQGFPPAIAEPLADVLARGEHYLPTDYGRVVTLRVDREDRHYLPRILAIGDALTEFKGAAVVLQDVTKFRLLDDAKTNLVGTVSHELKTPLTGLRMAVYLLLEQQIGTLTAPQRELLEGARDDADRLLRILDNLLDLARLEAGATALQRREIGIGELLAAITAEARGLFTAAGQRLEVQCAPEVEATRLHVDVDRLRHVFINLLANAAKFSPEGATIRLSAAKADPGFVRFAVHDEGPGIPADALTHVFDRFYRAPGQTKSGAGLGLAIAREIVVAHGGTIACRSEEGHGAEFHFLLPV
ncbi:integral membrane sensor signal transduction histidine kinase [Opitutus terrae PB90-1]|uniref:histidine kinase n=1 Tax=Opitutus terrae (strain DSM 11246 / JCM 15787 / PB90-1) TaxID=452637 RepID=B1ZUP4_OPITP|nr:ATP-binding protein [Opitutus terrae]ACB74928.1 integral membrane sensor signal transduction histidine kinase [Opitutus terrae PB90-1]